MYADEAYEALWLPYPRPQCDGPGRAPSVRHAYNLWECSWYEKTTGTTIGSSTMGHIDDILQLEGHFQSGTPPHNNMNKITHGKVALSGARCSDGLSGARQRIHTWGDRVHYCVLMTISREHCGPTT